MLSKLLRAIPREKAREVGAFVALLDDLEQVSMCMLVCRHTAVESTTSGVSGSLVSPNGKSMLKRSSEGSRSVVSRSNASR